MPISISNLLNLYCKKYENIEKYKQKNQQFLLGVIFFLKVYHKININEIILL